MLLIGVQAYYGPADQAAQMPLSARMLDAVRLCRQTRQEHALRSLLPTWSLIGLVAAIQLMRGVALMSAVTLVVKVGDFGRFTSLPQLMTWLELVPKEHSSGGTVRSHRLHQWVMILAAPDDGSVVIRLADGKVMDAD